MPINRLIAQTIKWLMLRRLFYGTAQTTGTTILLDKWTTVRGNLSLYFGHTGCSSIDDDGDDLMTTHTTPCTYARMWNVLCNCNARPVFTIRTFHWTHSSFIYLAGASNEFLFHHFNKIYSRCEWFFLFVLHYVWLVFCLCFLLLLLWIY